MAESLSGGCFAAYLRKSRAEEAAPAAEVLSRHRAALMELAQRQGVVISEFYEEVVSGESLYARPQMLRLLQAVEEDRYDGVLCMDIDRLGRGGMRDQGVILDAFKYSETLIITPAKIYDMSNAEDEEQTEMKSFFARYEYRAIRKRMQRGLIQTVKAGGYVANPPYGYKKAQAGKLPSLEIVEPEAVFVRHIFKRYLEGAGATSIADELNAMGSRPRRSSRWTGGTVRYILRNPTFIGKVVWNRNVHIKKGVSGAAKHRRQSKPESEWLIVQGLHPAIIDEETFNAAQGVRKNRYIPSKYDGETKHPLAGLIRCGKCGRTMQYLRTSGGAPYLTCMAKGCCAAAKMEYVEPCLIGGLTAALAGLDLPVSERDKSESDQPNLLEALEKEKARLLARRDRLYVFLEDGIYGKDEFRARMTALTGELDRLAQEESRIRAQTEKAAAPARTPGPRSLTQLLDGSPSMSPAQYNLLLKSLIKSAVYFKEKKTKPADLTIYLTTRDFF